MPGTERRWIWAGAALALVALPFLTVDFVPSTDLPQHLGQLRLFARAWADPDGPLRIQWWTPYGLVYGLLAIPWVLLPPVAAGRVGVLLLVLLQAAALHWVGAKYDRPIAALVLATAFLFHGQLYWGFLNFISGWIAFLVWFVLTRRRREDEPGRWRTAALYFAAAALLYLSHALWFALGVAWLAVEAAISRRSPRDLLWRAVGLAPVVVAAAIWFAFLRASDFTSPPEWTVAPPLRLHPELFALAALGGVRHPIEPIVVFGALAWAAAAIVAHRKSRAWGCDPYFAALAVLLFGLYLFLPYKFSNTIRFSTRWLPFAITSLLLAVDRPLLRRPLRRALAIALLATLMVVTTATWRRFERTELGGLAAALAALPEEPRVVGLSYVATSRLLYGQPFIQTFAWAQAVRGGELNFSFGYFAPSLVVYEDPGRVRWTWGLEWFPKRVRRRDFAFFDFALVSGDEAAHERMRALPELEPVTEGGVWRLYEVADSPPLAAR
ncbi:MAG: hypothetical protein OES32_00130 [Acidobacteriota bacterium]|nr:hypothetical protein [Acidobacteriota bacterium]MDH3521965.1 hypothetical protein [Acidobacteriota bacterium]